MLKELSYKFAGLFPVCPRVHQPANALCSAASTSLAAEGQAPFQPGHPMCQYGTVSAVSRLLQTDLWLLLNLLD